MKLVFLMIMLFWSTAMMSNGDPVPSAGTVSGVIRESGTDELLSGVKVFIAGTDLVTYTDREGKFSFEKVPLTDLQLNFSLVSFKGKLVELNAGSLPTTPIVVQMESR